MRDLCFFEFILVGTMSDDGTTTVDSRTLIPSQPYPVKGIFTVIGSYPRTDVFHTLACRRVNEGSVEQIIFIGASREDMHPYLSGRDDPSIATCE
jgi:hypothetical protein